MARISVSRERLKSLSVSREGEVSEGGKAGLSAWIDGLGFTEIEDWLLGSAVSAVATGLAGA